LTNACKHTDSGEIHVHCSSSEIEGMITFSVADTGTGVPEDKAEKIFERFTKLDSFKQGAGLGLNICKIITEKLNGIIRLDTKYKEGARFIFAIPYSIPGKRGSVNLSCESVSSRIRIS
ncbi:MAG: HAMP domain-containing histidine kinase, partial [Bacteroidales bacterium]|nr:HAMP domain-containing histidine kinase [Bacteroidales bacterium]